jgi:hypothetical protein
MSSNYQITTELNGTFEVVAGSIKTDLALKLVGRGAPGYGLAFAENTIKTLSNHASTASNRPGTATGQTEPLVGMLWYNSTIKAMMHYVGFSSPGVPHTGADQHGWSKIKSGSSGPLAIVDGGTGMSTIGTPGQVIRVAADGVSLEYTSNYVRTDGDSPIPVDNAWTVGTPTNRFRRIHAVVFDGEATAADYADVAERYEADAYLNSGDVVMLGGAKEITTATGENSMEVFGVVSTNPAFMMNKNAGDNVTHPYIALIGRVPVKVIGTATKGQRLVMSSTPGVAKAVTLGPDVSPFSVFGRVLADKTTSDVGLVEAVVGVK